MLDDLFSCSAATAHTHPDVTSMHTRTITKLYRVANTRALRSAAYQKLSGEYVEAFQLIIRKPNRWFSNGHVVVIRYDIKITVITSYTHTRLAFSMPTIKPRDAADTLVSVVIDPISRKHIRHVKRHLEWTTHLPSSLQLLDDVRSVENGKNKSFKFSFSVRSIVRLILKSEFDFEVKDVSSFCQNRSPSNSSALSFKTHNKKTTH